MVTFNLSILRKKIIHISAFPHSHVRKMGFLEQFLRSVEACENRTTEHRYTEKYSAPVCNTFYFQSTASSFRKIYVNDTRKLKHLQLRQQRQPSLKELQTRAIPHSSIKVNQWLEEVVSPDFTRISLLTHRIPTDARS